MQNATFIDPWTRWKKLRFYFSYFLSKAKLIFQVKKPKGKFATFEFFYSLINLINTIRPNSLTPVLYTGPDLITTSQGIFRVRPGSHDAALISPAYEGADVEFLFELLDSYAAKKLEVGFIDVGANIGSFSIKAANRNMDLRVWAFEPVPPNLEMLRSNINLNHLQNRFYLFPLALSDENGLMTMSFDPFHPGDSKSTASTLGNSTYTSQRRIGDELLSALPRHLIVKIDVEGHEIQSLRGLAKTLQSSDICWLCIEDIFDKEPLYAFLKAIGFKLQRKVTPYNSWWLLSKASSGLATNSGET